MSSQLYLSNSKRPYIGLQKHHNLLITQLHICSVWKKMALLYIKGTVVRGMVHKGNENFFILSSYVKIELRKIKWREIRELDLNYECMIEMYRGAAASKNSRCYQLLSRHILPSLKTAKLFHRSVIFWRKQIRARVCVNQALCTVKINWKYA